MLFNIPVAARRLRLKNRARARADVLGQLEMILRRRIAAGRPGFVH